MIGLGDGSSLCFSVGVVYLEWEEVPDLQEAAEVTQREARTMGAVVSGGL